MLQFTSRDLFAGIAAVGVAIAVRNWVAFPGMVAAGLSVFAIAASFVHPQSVAPRQMVLTAYFCLLLEFAWCAPANLEIVQWSYPLPNYWNTTGPISDRLRLSALVLVPLLFGAYSIVATRTRRHQHTRSRLLTWSLILGTASVVLMYLCLHTVFWFGMSHRDADRSVNTARPQSAVAFGRSANDGGAVKHPVVEPRFPRHGR